VVPYLKGLHLTIDSWRPGRDAEGWKVKKPTNRFTVWEWESERWIDATEEEISALGSDEAAPDEVEAVPRLRSDIDALLELTGVESPPTVLCRAKTRFSACYLMGDASGKGFGSAIWTPEGIHWESGNYGLTYREESSNFREAENLVQRLEIMGAEGRLDDAEIFTFTDNAVFEGTFYKGHSNSPKLNDIILRLRKVERSTGCILHVIHIAGTRMKAAGIDGLSRGDLLEGMLKAGSDPMAFVPLGKNAEERSPGVVDWVRSWWSNDNGSPWCNSHLKLLEPADWFSLHEVDQPRLWVPPPAAMRTILELFSEDRLVNPHIPHVFVVPRLMTYMWRKDLNKDADLLFTVTCGSPFWMDDMHEPLIVAVVLPLTHVPNYRGPWLARGTDEARNLVQRLDKGFRHWAKGRHDPDQLHDLEGYVPGLWETAAGWSRDLLFEFLVSQRSFPPVQQCLVRRMLPPGHPRPLPGPDSDRRGRRRGRGQRAAAGAGESPPKRPHKRTKR
jgi:hypothetical protein